MIFLSKKLKLLVVLLILIIIFGGFIIYSTFFNQETVKVGTTEFVLPSGYHEGDLNDFGAVSVSNGTNTVYLLEYNGSDEVKYVNKYLDFKKGSNESISISQFNSGNTTIYKTNNVNDTKNVHYWFAKGNKSYEIYTWDVNPEMDNIVMHFYNC